MADAKLPALLRLLEPRLGGLRSLPPEPPLEQVIVAILARGTSEARALTSLRRLRAAFVDWNEVRVSTVREIMDASGLGSGEAARERAVLVRDLLSGIHRRFNRLSLDALRGPRSKTLERRLERFLEVLGSRSSRTAAVIRRVLDGDSPPVPAAPGVARVVRRIGLTMRTPRAGELRALLTADLGAEDRLLALQLLHGVADDFCLEEEPRCPRCPAEDACAFRRTAARTARPKRRAPKAPKSGAPAAPAGRRARGK